MESEFDTTGTIAKISDNFSVVTVAVNNVPKSFSFSKYLLYVFGLQCEGQMANILDEGMEVDVRYKLSNGNVPSIVAVWIAEKPDHLCNDSALKPFYERRGRVIEVSEDNVLVRIDGFNHTVLVSKEVVFRDGCQIPDLDEGEEVALDAIPFDSNHPTGASYQATCVWVGSTPILIERFGLNLLTLNDPFDVQDPMEVLHGIVTVIPNEVMAFAEIGCLQHNGKVLLFRNSFAVDCVNIKDHINVGDSLCMRIRYEYLSGGNKQFYAAQAWRDGTVGDFNESPVIKLPIERAVNNPGVATEAVTAVTESGCDQRHQLTRRQRRINRASDHRRKKIVEQSASVDSDVTASERDTGSTTEMDKAEFIDKSGFLFNDPPLLGIISIISQYEASIVHNGLKIYVARKTIFKDGKPLTDDREYVMLVAPGHRFVNFEAVKGSSKAGFTHEATCVWVGKKPSLTLTKTENSPRHQPETNLERSTRVKAEKVAVKIDEAGDVLIGDPPLSGPITLTSKQTATITYQGFKIFLRYTNLYVDGKACPEKEFVLVATTTSTDVNFEAVKLSAGRYKDLVAKRWIGFTHEATCAWFGEKPSVYTVSLSPKQGKPEQKELSQTDCKSTEFNVTASSLVLYREDPPLQGILRHDECTPGEMYMSFDSVYISFEGLKVFLDCDLMYYKGKPCRNETVLDLISRDIPLVNFEAVKSIDRRMLSHGYSHEATCVWVGQRPGLLTIIRSFGPVRLDLLDEDDRRYRGVVRRFCLPKVALVHESQHDAIVCLHVSVFGRKPKHRLDFESGKDCINAFVKLNDVVEFKVTRVASFAFGLSAIDVKIVSTNKEKSAKGMSEGLLVTPFPEKSTHSTETGTLSKIMNGSETTEQKRAEELLNPYSIFESTSMAKVWASFEAQLTEKSKRKTPELNLQCGHGEMLTKFDPSAQFESISTRKKDLGAVEFTSKKADIKHSSDREKPEDKEAKAETGRVSVQLPLAEISGGIETLHPRSGSSSLCQEVPTKVKLTNQEIMTRYDRGFSDTQAKTETGNVRSPVTERPRGLFDPYPRFEASSMRKDVPVESRITDAETKEDVPPRNVMWSKHPEEIAVFSSDKDAKEETRSVSALSTVTERLSPSRGASTIGANALRDETRKFGNVREVSVPLQSTSADAGARFIPKSPSSEFIYISSPSFTKMGPPRQEAKERFGATKGQPDQSKQRSPPTPKCSMM